MVKRRFDFEQLLCAGLLVALGWNAGLAVSYASRQQPAIDSSDINICYRTDGEQIETSYIDTGTTDYYPIASIDEVEPTADGGMRARHETTFERRRITHVYLPMVSQ